jgi:hypothetical protein
MRGCAIADFVCGRVHGLNTDLFKVEKLDFAASLPEWPRLGESDDPEKIFSSRENPRALA